MKYPLAITIATLGIFAFMALIIISGELSFADAPPPSHTLRIDSVVKHCPDTLQKNIAALPADEAFTEFVRNSCNAQPDCTIKTEGFYTAYGDDNASCSDEIIIFYACKSATKRPIDDPAPQEKPVFFYEGQEGTLACTQNHS